MLFYIAGCFSFSGGGGDCDGIGIDFGDFGGGGMYTFLFIYFLQTLMNNSQYDDNNN